MIGQARAGAKELGLEVPTPRVPAEVPRVRPPEKVEVPRPFTFKRLASENEVEEAKWKNEAIEEVAVRYPVFKLFSTVSAPPMSAEPLCRERRAPGEAVARPSAPLAVRRNFSARGPVLRVRNWRWALAPAERLDVMSVPSAAVLVAALLTSSERKARREAVEVPLWRFERKSGGVVAAVEFTTSRLVPGAPVPIPTLPVKLETPVTASPPARTVSRSEEHTSELQS